MIFSFHRNNLIIKLGYFLFKQCEVLIKFAKFDFRTPAILLLFIIQHLSSSSSFMNQTYYEYEADTALGFVNLYWVFGLKLERIETI